MEQNLNKRDEKNAETRAKLIGAGRRAFGAVGYAEATMDDFTAEVGLTRGALYHQFGDKKGLFQAVVQEIDLEMGERLKTIAARADNRWDALLLDWTAYIEMALEPEIRRIVFCDGPAVLGDISQWAGVDACIMALKASLDELVADGVIGALDTEATARLINGASSHAATWIAMSPDPEATSRRAVAGFVALMDGLKRGPCRS